MRRLGVSAAGIPAFVVGREWEIGYSPGVTEARVQAMLRRAHVGAGAPRTIEVPLLGRIEPATVSLPALILSMGLVDGLNPCAMWVLLVLMGVLLQTRDTRRMLRYASVFVTMSGLVYFGFMTAWSALFSLVGLSSAATRALGVVLLVMGAINLKELVWFKRGVSLMIPDAAKPSLYRRMRGIVGAASAPAALGGVAALAFVVNLVELGCTLGLPAVYTRILSLRDLPVGERLAWIGLYNIAYVVPLTGVVLVVVTLRRKVSLGEGAARALKFVSGVALAGFGVLFLVAPEVMTSR
ncbi:MAG: NrdH-redoxin [Deltaproteobacteria bacterium]|nr:NrdH-redoxin [Myxococcales bacterium]MDP3220108.1 NrdH-redoxin [Deltaproteobacteria bacterium]